ncbi:MAG: alanine--glyoxylate aminotransferase family protein [Candidatus Omnitrophota bacterium]
MKRTYLLTPGPSPVSSQIREVLSREIMHHRTDEFRQILKNVHSGLREVFCTQDPVLVFSSSGTGAMEGAISNLFSAKDKVIVVSGGKFGQRWGEIASAYGLEVINYVIEWGTAPKIDEIDNLLNKNRDVKAVLTTLCETSTATVYDIKAMGELTRKREAVLIVDAISGLGQDELLTSKWGVDLVVSGSQKGLILPPGLAFIAINNKAKDLLKNSTLPKYYFSIAKALKSYEKDDTPFTPSVPLICALEKSLAMINAEGLEARWKKFRKLALATQKAAKAIGFDLFSKSPSASVTALLVPAGVSPSDLVKKLRKEYGLSIAGGQDALKDKIIRIAHMGSINQDDLIVGFSFLEKALSDLGYRFKLGVSLEKFQEVYYG